MISDLTPQCMDERACQQWWAFAILVGRSLVNGLTRFCSEAGDRGREESDQLTNTTAQRAFPYCQG